MSKKKSGLPLPLVGSETLRETLSEHQSTAGKAEERSPLAFSSAIRKMNIILTLTVL